MTAKQVDTSQSVVAVVGLFEGVLPLLGTLFGFSPLLSLPMRLDEGPRIAVSVAVVVVGLALMAWLERQADRA